MRFMKVIVMFDLPTGDARERKSYCEFRKNLIAEGYRMMQFSVYAKTCLGIKECESSVARIKKFLPAAGSVTALVLTEKQFASREVLIAPHNNIADEDFGEQLTICF